MSSSVTEGQVLVKFYFKAEQTNLSFKIPQELHTDGWVAGS